MQKLIKTKSTPLRKYIFNWRYIYRKRNDSFAIDESNFISDGNITTWVIGIININTRKIRLEFIVNRDTNTIKTFIHAHIKRGNIIVSVSWYGYAW